jgi:hypothetical protein
MILPATLPEKARAISWHCQVLRKSAGKFAGGCIHRYALRVIAHAFDADRLLVTSLDRFSRRCAHPRWRIA